MNMYQNNWYWGTPPEGAIVLGCSHVCIPTNLPSTQTGGGRNLPITGGGLTAGTPLQQQGIQCGVPRTEPETMIVNGQEARAHSWPWQVALLSLGYTSPHVNGHWCGGSLIAPDLILTAAHCEPQPGMLIIIGMHDYTNCVQPLCVTRTITDQAQVWIHPNYTSDEHPTLKVHNDIAIVKLSPPVQWGDTMSPICLPEPFQHPPEGTKCYATGWGNTIYHRHERSVPERLQQAQLPLLGDCPCMTVHSPIINGWAFIPTKMTCAGYLIPGSAGTCNGDSGGPLVCKLPGE